MEIEREEQNLSMTIILRLLCAVVTSEQSLDNSSLHLELLYDRNITL